MSRGIFATEHAGTPFGKFFFRKKQNRKGVPEHFFLYRIINIPSPLQANFVSQRVLEQFFLKLRMPVPDGSLHINIE
jgi:hypothetical protein